ncbi:hypothetical protein ABTW24_13190 [Sphingobacterium thalpophilum]|uniref:Uncharacterized protein n=1 Tax=Sphingobacterium thalpophilum TaxID=259 RepID=A0ABV4HG79_9SPHI|nr:hypothetical protein [Sphingobacterium thalpophilum]
MKTKHLFIAVLLLLLGSSKLYAQQIYPTPGDPLLPYVEFVEVLGEMGVLYPSTVEEQIAEFEIVFQPALEVIRNVDITGVSRKIAENRFNNYIWLNQPIKTAFLLGYSGTGVPYLSRVLDLYLDIEYGASGYFSGFPLEWVQYGYVIK